MDEGVTMGLIFGSREIVERSRALTFDDVLLVPQYSEISSRKTPVLRSKVTKNYEIDVPIVTANMDTITEGPMAMAMAKLGGLGSLHRFLTIEEQVSELQKVQAFQKEHGLTTPLAASIGVKEEGRIRAEKLAEAGVQIITLDIAHGDSIMMMETLKFVKDQFPNIDVIAGNVATPDAVRRLIDAGADAVKVGIGPGSMCTTRIITGHGMPQLTAIALCAEEAEKYGVPVIADGGLKTSGDMVKAFAAGAHTVMVGSLVAGTLETPGELKGGRKQYRGMASKAAQVSWRGELPKGMAAEGVDTSVACKGSVENVINELTGGIRSGMTYLGVDTLRAMKDAAAFVEMTASGMTESRPHGLN